jgi:multidrug efflux pump
VQQQFFPSASRPELLVDIRLAEGSSFQATAAEVAKMEALLAGDPDIRHVVAYTGAGTPRFYLPLDQQLQNANFAQFVVMSRDLEARERVKRRIEAHAQGDFPAARLRVSRLENGPPVGYPVQFRVLGGDPAKIRAVAYRLRDIVRANPNVTETLLDWDELEKRVRLDVDLSKARALGVSKQDLASALQMSLSGLAVTQYREGTELIDVMLRLPEAERLDLARIADLNVATSRGTTIPLGQVASVNYELEEPILWRRGRLTTMTVKADIVDGVQAPVVSRQIEPELAELRASLPDGYRIETGGAIEESGKGQASINKMLPLMALIMVATLMLQLQSFSRVFLVLLTAPLGLIGVTGALLLFHLPFGFVAMLGTIALGGIIMRNSVILVDQIDQDVAQGRAPFEAIVEATVRRARPILLTAAAAILGMIPLAPSVFWGPMAVAIMGGLAVATLLTLLFLPALYAAWFRVPGPAAVAMPRQAVPVAGE